MVNGGACNYRFAPMNTRKFNGLDRINCDDVATSFYAHRQAIKECSENSGLISCRDVKKRSQNRFFALVQKRTKRHQQQRQKINAKAIILQAAIKNRYMELKSDRFFSRCHSHGARSYTCEKTIEARKQWKWVAGHFHLSWNKKTENKFDACDSCPDINHECKPAEMFFRWFHKILKEIFSFCVLVAHEWARWALSLPVHRFVFNVQLQECKGLIKGFDEVSRRKQQKSRYDEKCLHTWWWKSWRKQLRATGLVYVNYWFGWWCLHIKAVWKKCHEFAIVRLNMNREWVLGPTTIEIITNMMNELGSSCIRRCLINDSLSSCGALLFDTLIDDFRNDLIGILHHQQLGFVQQSFMLVLTMRNSISNDFNRWIDAEISQ